MMVLGYGCRLCLRAEQDEAIYISVEATDVSFIPYYRIELTRYDDDFPNDRHDATRLAWPADVRGKIETTNDVDSFQFEVQLGQSYRLELETTQPIGNAGVRILGFDGRIDVKATAMPPTGGSYRRVYEWDNLSDTNIDIQVLSQASIDGSALGEYRLLGMTRIDDSTTATPRTIRAMETVFGAFETTNDEDWLTFVPHVGEFYQWVTNSSTPPVVERVDSLGQVTGWPLFTAWQADSDAAVHLRLRTFPSNAPNYDVTLLPIVVGPTDPRPLAVPLAINSEDTRSMWQYWGSTWFELPASDSPLQVTFAGSSQSAYWDVYDENLFVQHGGVTTQPITFPATNRPQYLKLYFETQQPVTTRLTTVGGDADDDTPATATHIVFGQTITAYRETVEDEDWYVFDAVADRDYLVHSEAVGITGTGSLNCLTGMCHWLADDTGPVYVQIQSGPAYEIRIDEYADEGNNRLESALHLNDNQVYRGSIGHVFDVDFYQATIAPNINYEIIVSSADVSLRLADFSGDPTAQWITLEPNRILLQSVQTPSIAKFLVSSRTALRDYEIKIIPHVDDFGNEEDSAAPIAIGQRVSGSLFGADGDMFVVQTEASRRYRVVVESDTPSIRISVSGNGISSILRHATTLDFVSNGAPAYVFLSKSVPSVDYHITVYDVPTYGTSVATAASWTLPVKQRVHSVGQGEMFRFDVVADAFYRVRIDSSNLNPAVITQGDSGPNLISINQPDVLWRSTVTGPVYLRLGNNAADYQIDLQRVNDEYNEADSLQSAVSIDIDTSFLRSFRNARDIDWFRVEAQASSTLELVWQPPYATDSSASALNVNVYYADDGTLAGQAELDEQYFDVGSRYLWWSSTTRPVIISVGLVDSPQGETPQTHRFELRSIPADHPATIAQSRRLHAPAMIGGNAPLSDHPDHFVFTAVTGKRYRVILVGGGASSITTMASQPLPNVSERNRIWTWNLPQSQTEDVLIRVGNDFWSQYTLHVSEIQADPQDSASQPLGKVVFGQRISGDLQSESDSDFYTFDAVEGTTYYVTAQSDSGDAVRIEILNATERVRYATEIVGLSNTGPFHWTAPATGSYQLAISGQLLNSGTFWFVMNAGDDAADELNETATLADSPLTLLLEDTYDVDWSRIEVVAGIAYALNIKSSGVYVPAVNLYDSDANRLATTTVDAPMSRTFTWLSGFTGSVDISTNENLQGFSGHNVLSWQVAAGDANLDGYFDSSDFVRVFQAGKYEDETSQDVTWAEGDWDGDGRFTSSDLVAAFIRGVYEQ